MITSISGRAANPDGGRRKWNILRREGKRIMPHPSGEFNAEQLKLLYRAAQTMLEEGELCGKAAALNSECCATRLS